MKPQPSNPTRQETPEVRRLVTALDALIRERSVLESAVTAVEKGRTKEALEKLRLLVRRARTAEAEMRAGLTHLKLYFALVWLTSGRDGTVHEVRKIDELLELFEIDDLNSLGHMEDPPSLETVRKILAKVERDMAFLKRVRSATPVANQLTKMAKTAEKNHVELRACLLLAVAGIVQMGLEDPAMIHLMPLLNAIVGRGRGEGGCHHGHVH
jgi:hypothetical protein